MIVVLGLAIKHIVTLNMIVETVSSKTQEHSLNFEKNIKTLAIFEFSNEIIIFCLINSSTIILSYKIIIITIILYQTKQQKSPSERKPQKIQPSRLILSIK